MLSAQNQPNKTVGSVLLSPVKSSQTRPTKQAGIINNFFFWKKRKKNKRRSMTFLDCPNSCIVIQIHVFTFHIPCYSFFSRVLSFWYKFHWSQHVINVHSVCL